MHRCGLPTGVRDRRGPRRSGPVVAFAGLGRAACLRGAHLKLGIGPCPARAGRRDGQPRLAGALRHRGASRWRRDSGRADEGAAARIRPARHRPGDRAGDRRLRRNRGGRIPDDTGTWRVRLHSLPGGSRARRGRGADLDRRRRRDERRPVADRGGPEPPRPFPAGSVRAGLFRRSRPASGDHAACD